MLKERSATLCLTDFLGLFIYDPYRHRVISSHKNQPREQQDYKKCCILYNWVCDVE